MVDDIMTICVHLSFSLFYPTKFDFSSFFHCLKLFIFHKLSLVSFKRKIQERKLFSLLGFFNL